MLSKTDILGNAIIVDENYWTLDSTPEMGLETFLDDALDHIREYGSLELGDDQLTEIDCWRIVSVLSSYYESNDLWGKVAMNTKPVSIRKHFMSLL